MFLGEPTMTPPTAKVYRFAPRKSDRIFDYRFGIHSAADTATALLVRDTSKEFALDAELAIRSGFNKATNNNGAIQDEVEKYRTDFLTKLNKCRKAADSVNDIMLLREVNDAERIIKSMKYDLQPARTAPAAESPAETKK